MSDLTDNSAVIDRASWALLNPYNGDLVKARVLNECLGVLRAHQVRIAELEAERDDYRERARMCLDLQEIAEAERDNWRERYNEVAENHKDRMADQRDAIRAKTFEECAAIALNPGFVEAQDTEWDEGVNYAKAFIAKRIRALAQKDESKTETGE